MWIIHSRLIGSHVQLEPCTTIWIWPQAKQRAGLSLLQERLWQRYLLCHYLFMDQTDCNPLLWALWSKPMIRRSLLLLIPSSHEKNCYQPAIGSQTFTQLFYSHFCWHIQIHWQYKYRHSDSTMWQTNISIQQVLNFKFSTVFDCH